MLWQALPSGLCLHVHRLVSTSRSYTHTHTRLFTPCFTCTAYTQEPNHNGGTQEDKGTTVHTLPTQEDKGTTAPTQEAVSITHHTNSLASNEPPDVAHVNG